MSNPATDRFKIRRTPMPVIAAVMIIANSQFQALLSCFHRGENWAGSDPAIPAGACCITGISRTPISAAQVDHGQLVAHPELSPRRVSVRSAYAEPATQRF
jgi:hypothetical protein